MLHCGTWVFHTPKSQVMPIDFATQVKCGFVSEHGSVLETIHLQPLQITASSEHSEMSSLSVLPIETWSFPFMLYLHLWNKLITAVTAMFSFCTIHSELHCTVNKYMANIRPD
jgi:hypothetical protein